jgi:hypothetical protein
LEQIVLQLVLTDPSSVLIQQKQENQVICLTAASLQARYFWGMETAEQIWKAIAQSLNVHTVITAGHHIVTGPHTVVQTIRPVSALVLEKSCAKTESVWIQLLDV